MAVSPDVPIVVVVAFPLHLADRADARRVFGAPLPRIYPDSVSRPCDRCGMVLAVGPRSLAKLDAGEATALICPFCLKARVEEHGDVEMGAHLGNPDSEWEP